MTCGGGVVGTSKDGHCGHCIFGGSHHFSRICLVVLAASKEVEAAGYIYSWLSFTTHSKGNLKSYCSWFMALLGWLLASKFQKANDVGSS